MSSFLRRAAISAIIAKNLVLGQFAPVAAHRMDRSWDIGSDLIGYCGMTSGGWVGAVQGNLITHYPGGLGATGPYQTGVDFQFGNATYQKVRQWQSDHGLSVDGCVGQATWGNMKAPNVHRHYLGTLGTTEYWAIADHALNRPYLYYIDACWGGYQDISSATGPFVNDTWWVDHGFNKVQFICL